MKDAKLRVSSHLQALPRIARSAASRIPFVNRRALAKIVMFLQLLEQHQDQTGKVDSAGEIYLAINRSAIGEYVGMSLEAVSRSFRTLMTRGIIKMRDKRHVKIIDRVQFDANASEQNAQV